MQKKSANQLLLSAALSLVILLLLRWQGKDMMHPSTPSGILALEFANTPEKLNYVLSFWNRNMVRNNILIDFLFILAYTWFFVTALAITAGKWQHHLMKQLGAWLIRLSFLAAMLDVVENILMLQSIAGHYSVYSLQLTWYCASIKFGIVILVLVYIFIGRVTALFNRKSS